MEEIINKVANSALEVFDLEDYYPYSISGWHFTMATGGFYWKKKILGNTS
jgi:hypothetical protein